MNIVPKHFLCTLLVSTASAALLAGCGSGAAQTTTAPPKAKPPALAAVPAAKGEIVVRGDASPKTAGPYAFSGTYRVRFVQYAPEDPRHDFAGETAFVADLERQEGVPAKRLFRVAATSGAKVMQIHGRYYVDVSFGDFPFAVRFTPVRR